MTTVLFIGRFQPFHLGHLGVLKRLAEKQYTIIIAIGSSRESNTKANPFSSQERKQMIKNVCKQENIQCRIVTVPDMRNDDDWMHLVKKQCGLIDVVYTNNSWCKLLFNNVGIPVKIIRELPGISGQRIRKAMIERKPWASFVHPTTARIITLIKGEQRVRKLAK